VVERYSDSVKAGPADSNGAGTGKGATHGGTAAPKVHDRRSLTYANSFDSAIQGTAIRAIEWLTGKITIIRMVRKFEKMGAPRGQAFWPATLKVMGIDLLTPAEQLARIPKTGPVVVVANHPHGLVDGMILADLIGRVRPDYKILTRALLTGIDEVASSYMIPVPFPYEDDAQRKFVEMRGQAMDHLRAGGLVTLFPSGVVASSDTMFGPAVEREWNVFTAQMIRRSGAQVVPVHFTGANSRLYQIANRISATLRQGLLLHEIVYSCNKAQAPVVGHPIPESDMELLKSDPRGFMAWLRAHTLSLNS
jgi:putative hemolysin